MERLSQERTQRLSPCGESGLKFTKNVKHIPKNQSLPMRGEWIEIDLGSAINGIDIVSPHAGRVD